MRLSDDVINEFIDLLENVRDSQFQIGDRLIELIDLHGDKTAVINNLAGNLNISASVLYDYVRTAERWSPAMRQIYVHLDYTLYRNTDPHNPEDMALLDQAIDEGWTATRYKEQKYPSMRDPATILGKVKGLLAKIGWRPEVRSEIETIIKRLDELCATELIETSKK
jgi:hypothetical protein